MYYGGRPCQIQLEEVGCVRSLYHQWEECIPLEHNVY